VPKLANIQILRFIAAILVFYSHLVTRLELFHGPGRTEFWRQSATLGSYGVDIFFVISGFVISQSYAKKKSSPKVFILNRLFRIYPLYAFVTTIFYISHLFFENSVDLSQFSFKHYFASMFFVSQALTFGYPIIPQGWTLELEIVFYLVFLLSIVLSLLFRIANNKEKLLSSITILTLVATGSPSILIEFIFGFVLASIWVKFRRKRVTYLVAIYIFISIFYIVKMQPNHMRVLFIGSIATGFVYLAIVLPQVPGKLAIFLGNISYGVYLFHGIIIGTILQFGPPFIGNSAIVVSITSVVTVIVISTLSYIYFEKPILYWSKTKWF